MNKPYILKNVVNKSSCENKNTFEYNYDIDMSVIKDNGLPLIDKLNNLLYGTTSTENFNEADDIDLNILSFYTKTHSYVEQDDETNMFF